MGRTCKHFKKADEKFISENCDFLTVSQIAKCRKIPYNHVYNYMTRHGIPMLTERAKKQKNEGKKKGKSKFFDPNSKDWIL
jgi:hypothetical protein